MKPGHYCIVLEELNLKIVDEHSEVFYLGVAFRQIPRLSGLSVLEGQVQDRSMRQLTLSCSHNVVDQRSGDDFTDFERLDAKIASALKRIILNQHFRRRS